MKLSSFRSRLLSTAVVILATPLAALAEPLLGVFGENSMDRVIAFERWLGRPVDVILCTVDFQKWENYRWADWLSKTVYGERGTRRLVYDVPIIITGANYAEAKAGAYDAHWESLAKSILSNNPGEFEILIRPSHEMNGHWFVWGVGGDRQAHIPDFIAAWRRFHGVFRGVPDGTRFRFSFSTSEGGSDPRPMWPGDDYADVVGHDVYWKPKSMGGEGWETEDPLEAWRKRTSDPYDAWRLAGMLAFARSKGKPFSVDEWGVWGPNAGPFVTAMAEFLRSNDARSHTYWNSNAAYPGELHTHGDTWPGTVAAFKKAFGR